MASLTSFYMDLGKELDKAVKSTYCQLTVRKGNLSFPFRVAVEWLSVS